MWAAAPAFPASPSSWSVPRHPAHPAGGHRQKSDLPGAPRRATWAAAGFRPSRPAPRSWPTIRRTASSMTWPWPAPWPTCRWWSSTRCPSARLGGWVVAQKGEAGAAEAWAAERAIDPAGRRTAPGGARRTARPARGSLPGRHRKGQPHARDLSPPARHAQQETLARPDRSVGIRHGRSHTGVSDYKTG